MSRAQSRVQVVAAVDVASPPAEVFGYLADVARHTEWSPKPLRIEGVAPGRPAAAGTTFVSYGWVPGDSEHRNDVEVTRAESPSVLELLSTEGDIRCHNRFTITAAGPGSRVERVMDLPRPGGLVGLVFPLIARTVIRSDVAKGLRALKANVETASRAG